MKIQLLPIVILTILAVGCWPSPAPAPTPSAARPSETPVPIERTTAIRFVARSGREHYQALARAFEEANPTVQVEVLDPYELSLHGLELREQMTRMATHADVFEISDWDLGWLRDSGLIRDLQVLRTDHRAFGEADFYPGVLARFESQGGMWGVPAHVVPRLMVYRADLFDQAGVAYPEPGWTWDEFLTRALALTDLEADPPIYGFAEGWRYDVAPWVYQHGGAFVDTEAAEEGPLFQDSRGREAVDWYLDLARVHRVMPGQDSPDALGATDLGPVAAGRAAMWIDFPVNWPALETGKWGVAPLPRDQVEASLPVVSGYFISANAADPQACWRWIDYLSRQPPEPGALPVRRSVAESEEYERVVGAESAETYRYILEHDQLDLAPGQHGWFVVAHDWLASEGVASVLGGRMTVEEMLAEAQRRALAALGQVVEVPTMPPPRATTSSSSSTTRLTFFAAVDVDEHRRLATAFEASRPRIKIQPKELNRWTMEGLARTTDVFQYVLGLEFCPDLDECLLDLNPLLQVSDLDLDDFYPRAVEAFRWGGSLRCLPASIDARMLFYNQDLFDEAGVAYPRPDWTWEDLLEAAAQLTDGEGTGRRYGFVSHEGMWVADVVALAFQRGGRLVDDLEAPTAPTLDDPALVEALRWYTGLVREHKVMPPPFDPLEDKMKGWATVEKGRAAMWLGGVGTLGWESPSFRLGVVPMPADEQPATFFLFSCYALSPQRPNVEAAWEWLQFISEHAEQISWLPARKSLLPQARFSRVPPDSRQALRSAYLATVEQYQDASYAVVRARVPWFAEVYDLFHAAAERVMEEGEDPELALSQAQQEALQVVERYSSP